VGDKGFFITQEISLLLWDFVVLNYFAEVRGKPSYRCTERGKNGHFGFYFRKKTPVW